MADERRNTPALLAKSANRSHRWAVAGAAMAHVVAAAHALVQARDLCEQGGWLRWLRTNFEGSVRTAQRYMRVARHLPASGIDATRVSHRSRTALLRGVVFTEPSAAAWYLPSEQELNAVLPASSSILDDFAHVSPTLPSYGGYGGFSHASLPPAAQTGKERGLPKFAARPAL